MAAPVVLPEPLLARFRSVAFERLERIDGAWSALMRGSAGTRGDEEMFRELHTLKGDARVVGFADVATLCQRLEDLLSAARLRRYRVHEDVDVVVTMAIQFAGMLLRKKAGATRGIDLDGFLAQIDVVRAERLQVSAAPAAIFANGRSARPEAGQRMTADAQARMGIATTTVYLEHLRASGASSERLREAWAYLRREIADLESVALAPVIERQARAARELARELGKAVDVRVEGPDLWVNPDVLEAVNTCVLHAVRNAVDHGIDSPADRARAGKAPAGTVRVRWSQRDDMVEVLVSDDGTGIDFDSVRRRAERLGMPLPRRDAGGPRDDESLTELLFAPGFSTRDHVTETSGRGVGLDAVRQAAARLGGTTRIQGPRGQGTTLRVALPDRRAPIDVLLVRAAGAPIPFALHAGWQLEPQAAAGSAVRAPSLDLVSVLDLPRRREASPAGTWTVRRGERRLAIDLEEPPGPASAARLCATPHEFGIEVVALASGEALMVRPEALLGSQPSEVVDA